MIEVMLRHPSGVGVIATGHRIPTRIGTRRVIVFIHGFATNPHAARRSYISFASRMLAALGSSRWPVSTELAAVHWPGDDPNKILNKLTFSSRPGEASNSGRALSLIQFDGAVEEVVIVAHSLGCRVALEYMRHLYSEGRQPGRSRKPRRPRVIVSLLMAAAVPTDQCLDAGLFPRDSRSPTREVVLYSKRDLVLKRAFPFGNRGHAQGWSPAVGRTGGPANRWDSSSEEFELGHGDYWGSAVAAKKLIGLLHEEPDRSLMIRRLKRRPRYVSTSEPSRRARSARSLERRLAGQPYGFVERANSVAYQRPQEHGA